MNGYVNVGDVSLDYELVQFVLERDLENLVNLLVNTLSPKSKFTPLSPIGIISTFFQGWKDEIAFLIRPAIRKFN